MCYRCFWPQAHCWCGSLRAMPTRTRFVFLLHPKEFKEEKAGTGRLTQLCLARSELHPGVEFARHERVQEILHDPASACALLYPGAPAWDLAPTAPRPWAELQDLTLFILDGTWSCTRKMLKLNPCLQRLPRLRLDTPAPSRFVIKQQPQAGCLSTLEATHEVLLALDRAGIEPYADPRQLLDVFARMQQFQIQCAGDPARGGYRRHAYQDPATRLGVLPAASRRRRDFLRDPAGIRVSP